MSEWIGRTLSKVQIERLLGRGGMADVYLGRHTTLNRPVAIKILQPHLVEDESQLRRFTAEAQAIAGLRHPHIVQVFDFDVLEGRPYIVMELLQGLSLKDYLQAVSAVEQKVPVNTTARLISQVASALDYAHQRGIVHRDIKPANVMLRKEQGSIDLSRPLPDDVDAVLTDFGVARIADAAGATASGTIIGTPAYMSPEQVRGLAVDSRTDIYSMGVMLYEMLSGELPFEGETQASLLIKHMTEPPKPLPSGTPEAQAVLDRALAKDPDARFQTAAGLSNAFNVSVGLPVALPETEPVPPAARPMDSIYETATTAVLTSPAALEQTRPGAQEATGAMAPTRKTNPLVIAGSLAGVLALVLVVLALADVFGGGGASETPEATQPAGGGTAAPTESSTAEVAASEEPTPVVEGSPTVDVSTPRGAAGFADATVTVTLAGIAPPPEGSAYEAWLIDAANPPLSLGVVQVADSNVSVVYADPSGENLLATYSGFALSVEPASDSDPAMSSQVAYRGQLDETTIQQFRLMNDKTRGEPLKPTLLDALPAQAEQYDNHVNLAVGALTNSDLPGGKTHSEHVINIALGESSPDYRDWNGNGRPDNPGDGVGLETYLLLLALAASDGSEAGTDVQDQVEDIIVVVEDAVDLAKRIAAADTFDEAQPLALDLGRLAVKNAVTVLLQSAEDLNLAIPVEIFAVAP